MARLNDILFREAYIGDTTVKKSKGQWLPLGGKSGRCSWQEARNMFLSY